MFTSTLLHRTELRPPQPDGWFRKRGKLRINLTLLFGVVGQPERVWQPEVASEATELEEPPQLPQQQQEKEQEQRGKKRRGRKKKRRKVQEEDDPDPGLFLNHPKAVGLGSL